MGLLPKNGMAEQEAGGDRTAEGAAEASKAEAAEGEGVETEAIAV